MSATDNPEQFLWNARNAVENGYDLICAQCGNGMSDEEFEDADMHDAGCLNAGRDRAGELSSFLRERLTDAGLEPRGSTVLGAPPAADAQVSLDAAASASSPGTNAESA